MAEGEAEKGREVGEEGAEAVAQAGASAEEFLEAVPAYGVEAAALDGGAFGGAEHPRRGVEKHRIGVAVGGKPAAFGGAESRRAFARDKFDHAVDNVEHVEAGAAGNMYVTGFVLTVKIYVS